MEGEQACPRFSRRRRRTRAGRKFCAAIVGAGVALRRIAAGLAGSRWI
jgi:hypothetical protein